MAQRYFIQGLLAISFLGFQETTDATQKKALLTLSEKDKECIKLKASLTELEKNLTEYEKEHSELKEKTPRLKDILDNSVPWGVNLEKMEKRGSIIRKVQGGGNDFSSKITLYQKHSSNAKELIQQRLVLQSQLENAKKSKKSLNPLKAYSQSKEENKIKKQIKTIDEKTKNSLDIKMMNQFGENIKCLTGLKQEQLDKLPSFETKKGMKDHNTETDKNPKNLATKQQAFNNSLPID